MKKVVAQFVSAAALATIGMVATTDSMAAVTQQSYSNNGSSAGVFVSGNLGWGKVNFSQTPGSTGFKNSGFAWNGNLGYQYNRYVAVEAGYTSFADSSETLTSGVTPSAKHTFGIDLLAKGIYPINSKFSVFAKAGVEYLDTKLWLGATGFNHTVGAGAGTLIRYVPEFGVGAGYNITRQVAVEAQGLTTLAVKGSGAGVPSLTMPATYLALAGVSYKFSA